jgi:hypothetical protein
MFKLIGFIIAALPVFMFLRAIFGPRLKRSKALADFKRHLDQLVWVILFFIGCAVVYALVQLIYGHLF